MHLYILICAIAFHVPMGLVGDIGDTSTEVFVSFVGFLFPESSIELSGATSALAPPPIHANPPNTNRHTTRTLTVVFTITPENTRYPFGI